MLAKTLLAKTSSLFALLALGPLSLGCTAHSQALFSKPRHRCDGQHEHKESLRVASYNIRAGKSSSLTAVYETLKAMDADVISLQEVEVTSGGGSALHQAQWLADKLGMEMAFAGARTAGETGHFGVAVLSRLPILETTRVPLVARFALEPRVALDVKLCAGRAKPLRVIAVHSDVFGWSSRANATTLAELSESSIGEGVLIAGDLNATPDGQAVVPLKSAGLADIIAEHAEGVTFPGFPTARLDYLFVDGPLRRAVKSVRIDKSTASDHYPVVADFDLRSWGSPLLASGD